MIAGPAENGRCGCRHGWPGHRAEHSGRHRPQRAAGSVGSRPAAEVFRAWILTNPGRSLRVPPAL